MITAVLKERFQQGLGLLKRIFARYRNLRLALLGGVLLLGSILLLGGLLVAYSNHSPNLAHLRVGVLSGTRRRTTMRSSTPSRRRPGSRKDASTTSGRPARSRTSPG